MSEQAAPEESREPWVKTSQLTQQAYKGHKQNRQPDRLVSCVDAPPLIFMKIIITCAVLSALLIGCATVPIASDSKLTEARQFQPPAGMANIYLLRRESFAGSAILFQTAVDGKMSGALQTGTFILVSVLPGTHSIGAFSDGGQNSTEVTVQANQNYFFDIKSSTGWVSAQFSINSIDEADARQAVQRMKRAKGM